MTFDASDRKSVRKAEKEAKLSEATRLEFTRSVMSTPQGRNWIHGWLSRCSVFATPFVRGAPDATNFNCGTQNVGLQLFSDVVNACPQEYVLMMQEASQKEIVKDVRRAANASPDTSSAAADPGSATGSDSDSGWHDQGSESGADEWGPIPAV